MAIGWAMAMLAAATPAPPSPDAAAIERLVERFNTARTDFDAAALADTLDPEYQEISPVGDVDDRVKVLGFYRPEDRRPAPPMQGSERQIVVRGATGIETERRTITMTRPDGTTVTRSIRVRYVAMRAPNGWKLVSAQYTPIPPAK